MSAPIDRARAAQAAGRLDEAAAAYGEVVAVAPDDVEANAFLGRHAARRGDRAGAVRHAERAVQARPLDPALHEALAEAHMAVLAAPGAETVLGAVCTAMPFAFTSLLHLSRLREQRGDARRAATDYARAIRTAQLRGLWHGAESTPPWLVTPVQHAMAVAVRWRTELFDDWLAAAVKRHGRAEMKRVADCIAMYLGTRPTVYADPRQKPSFLYFPGLPIAPVFERDALAFAPWYEELADAIRDEALEVLERQQGIQPFHYDVPEERRGALTRGAWDAYFFYDEGTADAAHHAACPQTSSALARLPLDHVPAHGPEVCFSIMRPGAHILPHRGVTNTRSVLHLGLEVPPGCALNLVGVRTVEWQRGRCFAFDDTYEHEAWNRSDTTRVILLADIWNPHLTAPEREAVADLVVAIAGYNRTLAGESPGA